MLTDTQLTSLERQVKELKTADGGGLYIISGLVVVAYCSLFLSNAVYAFDDMLLFGKYSRELESHGVWGGAVRIFFGADLPSEYRAYGLSRVVHYFIYIMWGKSLLLYALLICASQVATWSAYLGYRELMDFLVNLRLFLGWCGCFRHSQ